MLVLLVHVRLVQVLQVFLLEHVIRESRSERLRIQEEAESRREFPMIAS